MQFCSVVKISYEAHKCPDQIGTKIWELAIIEQHSRAAFAAVQAAGADSHCMPKLLPSCILPLWLSTCLFVPFTTVWWEEISHAAVPHDFICRLRCKFPSPGMQLFKSIGATPEKAQYAAYKESDDSGKSSVACVSQPAIASLISQQDCVIMLASWFCLQGNNELKIKQHPVGCHQHFKSDLWSLPEVHTGHPSLWNVPWDLCKPDCKKW